jgi:hypothetical protein
MSAHPYFLVMAALALGVSVLFLWRDKRRSFNENAHATEKEASLPFGWDPLTSELSARIFDPEDADFVTRECSRQIAQSFRGQRAALALDWLLEVRKHVNLLMRAHRMAARSNPGLKPAGELRLGFEFLLFQITTEILYLVIGVIGPPHAAALVGYSLQLAGRLREMTEAILPAASRVAVELMDIEPQVKNRTTTL